MSTSCSRLTVGTLVARPGTFFAPASPTRRRAAPARCDRVRGGAARSVKTVLLDSTSPSATVVGPWRPPPTFLVSLSPSPSRRVRGVIVRVASPAPASTVESVEPGGTSVCSGCPSPEPASASTRPLPISTAATEPFARPRAHPAARWPPSLIVSRTERSAARAFSIFARSVRPAAVSGSSWAENAPHPPAAPRRRSPSQARCARPRRRRRTRRGAPRARRGRRRWRAAWRGIVPGTGRPAMARTRPAPLFLGVRYSRR